MMRVVNLGDEIRDRELQSVGEEAARLVLWRKAELGAEILEDVGDMRDDDGAVAQERGRERGLRGAALEHRYHRFHAPPGPALPRDVDIRRAGGLEREAHKLAAPLDARPVVELIRHVGPSFESARSDVARRPSGPPRRYGLPASRGSICGRMRSAALT